MAMRRPLRVRVGVGALTPHGQAAAMADALIAADLDLPLDVLLDFPPQVPFDLEVRLDVTADPGHLVVGEVTDPGAGVDAGLVAHTSGAGEADPVDVGQPDLEPLVPGKVNACDTCHSDHPCRCL